MIQVKAAETAIPVVEVKVARLTAAVLSGLRKALQDLRRNFRSAALIDLSLVKRITPSGLGALIELYGENQSSMEIAFFGCADDIAKAMKTYQLRAILPVFADKPGAQRSAKMRQHRLTDTPAIVLCNARDHRLGAMKVDTCPAMMPVLDVPVLDHVINGLSRYGVREFHINATQASRIDPRHFPYVRERSVFITHEGGAALGTAETLFRLSQDHSVFRSDVIVTYATALHAVDVAEMMEHHRATGADITIAVSGGRSFSSKEGMCEKSTAQQQTLRRCRGARASESQSVGVFILSPAAMQDHDFHMISDLERDLLPSVASRTGRVEYYETHDPAFDVLDPNALFSGTSAILCGQMPAAVDLGDFAAGKPIFHATANVSPLADISGPVYVGADAIIHKHARIVGPAVVGAGCRVEPRSVLDNSVLWPNSTLNNGDWLKDMIAGDDWAVSHRAQANHRPFPVAATETLKPKLVLKPALAPKQLSRAG